MARSSTRLGGLALAVAAVMFVLYPALRPWHDETTVAGATTSMSSGAWVAAHLCAMLGFILMSLGLLAIGRTLRDTAGGAMARMAIVTTWAGAGLTLPYYGAEDFGLHAIAAHRAPGLLDLIKAVRYQPVAITTFTAGLLLLGVGGALTAAAVWRSGRLGRYSGILYGVAFVSFIPQFYLPAAGRVMHGALTGLGAAVLASALWRAP